MVTQSQHQNDIIQDISDITHIFSLMFSQLIFKYLKLKNYCTKIKMNSHKSMSCMYTPLVYTKLALYFLPN